MSATVAKRDQGWVVIYGSEIVAGPFETNGEAWRALDRLHGEPVSRGEKTSEWLWNNMAHGE